VGKLAVFFKTAKASFHKVLAQLSLVLLLKCVKLTLVAVEVVIVALLSQMTENLGWWVVEVARPSILITLVVSSFAFLGSISGLGLLIKCDLLNAFSLDWRRCLGFKRLLLLEVFILDGRGILIDLVGKGGCGGS
jgi:hypothetical protein